MESKVEEDLRAAKEDVRDYLEKQAAATGDPKVQTFTVPALKEALSSHPPERIEEAIQDLNEQDWIDKHDIHVKVVLPASSDGEEILASYAEEGLISASPYMSIFLAGVLTYTALYTYGRVSPPPNPPATSDLFMDAVLMAAIVLPILGSILATAWSKIRRRKLVSDQLYLAAAHHTRLIVYTSAGLLALYWLGSGPTTYEFSQAGVIGVLGIGLTLGWVAAQLLYRYGDESPPQDPRAESRE